MKRNRSRMRARSAKRFPTWIWIGIASLYTILFWRSGADSRMLVIDGLLALGSLVVWLFFFSQFTLPVRRASDRLRVFTRVAGHLFGLRGPNLYLENGKIKERKAAQTGRGPGVILLDTASAAVLRTPVQYTRAVGPGVVFTRPGEAPAGVVDLRLQRNRCGPKAGEDPFAPRMPEEKDDEYEARQQRRQETRGLTRDGIEAVPQIMVVFRLDSRYGEGNTDYGYNASAVEKAVIGRNIDLSRSPDAPDRLMQWQWLPVHLAADVWKECISKFALDDLFQKDGQAGSMDTVRQMVSDRLTQPESQMYDPFGRPVERASNNGRGQPVVERSEAYWILKNRGIQVMRVQIDSPRFPEVVEHELVQRWKTNWLVLARQEQQLVERRRGLEVQQGRKSAQNDALLAIGRALAEPPRSRQLTEAEILDRTLRGSLALLRNESSSGNELSGAHEHIRQMMDWLTHLKESGR